MTTIQTSWKIWKNAFVNTTRKILIELLDLLLFLKVATKTLQNLTKSKKIHTRGTHIVHFCTKNRKNTQKYRKSREKTAGKLFQVQKKARKTRVAKFVLGGGSHPKCEWLTKVKIVNFRTGKPQHFCTRRASLLVTLATQRGNGATSIFFSGLWGNFVRELWEKTAKFRRWTQSRVTFFRLSGKLTKCWPA